MSGDGAALGPEGLRTDQAPPLSIPASFFLVAPLAMVSSGLLIAAQGANAVANRLLPAVLAGTHLATLGFIGSLMVGALYQMIPVVAGAPVPFVRMAHGVHAAWVGGVAALVFGLATGTPIVFRVAQGLLGAALLGFLVPVSVALARTPAKSDTVTGMRLAVLGLLVLGGLGLGLAEARASGRLFGGGDWVAWITAHAALGGLVWVGGILTSVSWQVVPMFYLTEPLPIWSRRATLAAIALALVGVPAALVAGASPRSVALAALPAALAIWGVHPVVTALALRRRRRRRADTSVRFWLAGLACAPVALALALATAVGESPRWSVALGWVVLWGWAGLIAHGMSCRIVPFLVFFHRFSPLVGLAPVPSMKDLLPESRQRAALLLHAAAVVTGAAGIAGDVTVVARAGGLLLAAAGVVMEVNLIRTLRRSR